MSAGLEADIVTHLGDSLLGSHFFGEANSIMNLQFWENPFDMSFDRIDWYEVLLPDLSIVEAIDNVYQYFVLFRAQILISQWVHIGLT